MTEVVRQSSDRSATAIVSFVMALILLPLSNPATAIWLVFNVDLPISSLTLGALLVLHVVGIVLGVLGRASTRPKIAIAGIVLNAVGIGLLLIAGLLIYAFIMLLAMS